ncbi:MAG: hypothetical protein P8X58_03980 [Syntrophobacterales bacterium]
MNTWILVIDDDAGTREALTEILGRAGYQVSSWADDALLEIPDDVGRDFQVAIIDDVILEVVARLCHPEPL